MTNYLYAGETVEVTAPYALASGAGCLVGSLFGVATDAAAISTSCQIKTVGVFTLPKTSALAISEGDTLYWDDTAKELNKTTSGVAVAVAVASAANPSSTVQARLLSGYNVPIGESIIRYTTVAVTNAQLKALRATPKELVAAPGAGKVLEFVSGLIFMDYGTNALTETADNLVVRFENTTGAIVSQTIEMTGFIDQTADMVTGILPKVDPIVTSAGSANKALVLHNSGDGEFGGNAAADTVLSVKIAYRVHTL